MLPELLYHERAENNVPESGKCHVAGKSHLYSHATEKFAENFRLTAEKSWYPNIFNTGENLSYVGPAPDISYYDVYQMRESERKEFLSLYETKVKNEVFDKRHIRTLLFLQSMNIAPASNKMFRKKFLHPHRIGITPAGGTRITEGRVIRRSLGKYMRRGWSARESCTGEMVRSVGCPNCRVYVCGRPLRGDAHCEKVQRLFQAWSYMHAFPSHAYRMRGRHLDREVR